MYYQIQEHIPLQRMLNMILLVSHDSILPHCPSTNLSLLLFYGLFPSC